MLEAVMRGVLNKGYSVSELAERLGLPWKGNDIDITHIAPLSEAIHGSLSFSKNIFESSEKSDCVIIAPEGTIFENGVVIFSEKPRLTFALTLHTLSECPGFMKYQEKPEIAPDAIVSSTAVIGYGVKIGSRSYIGENVVIADGVSIGADCYIKSNTVVGEQGFGFERDSDGSPVRILHLGGVTIGDRVEIGSLNTVCRGTIGDTIIENDVKIDDHVHIAHNCHVRRGALITACVELSGGVDVGEYSWIGPNSSILQKISLGDNSFISIASNVVRDVAENTSVGGNPARAFPKKND
jgi:UDP-3-O-[3-hydroxymyristoyl] glucosamine N-acyltransferase